MRNVLRVVVFLLMVLFLLWLPMITRAQAPAPDPLESGWPLSINGAISTLSQQNTNNGAMASVGLRLAQHWVLRSDVFILNSPSVTIALLGPEYRFSAAHLFKGSSSGLIQANAVEIFINGKAGSASSTAAAVDSTSKSTTRFAFGVGGGFDIKVSDTVSIRPLDLSYLRGSFMGPSGAPQHISAVVGNHISFAAGIGIRLPGLH
jgi:hypothetical protein